MFENIAGSCSYVTSPLQYVHVNGAAEKWEGHVVVLVRMCIYIYIYAHIIYRYTHAHIYIYVYVCI